MNRGWGLVLLCVCLAGGVRADDAVFRVPRGQRQLFLDDHGIEKISNLKRTMHSPRKRGAVIRPPFLGKKPSSIQTRSGPQWDAERGVYRLWLISKDCFESRDGLHWVATEKKPTLPVISAVIDPDDPDPSRRYKGLVSTRGKREPVVSPDGIAWKKLAVPSIPSQDESNLSYDEVTRTFIATVKHSGPYGRTVWLSTSRDFQSWSKPELIFHPDEQDQKRAGEVIRWRIGNKALLPMFQNNPKDYNVQVYNMGVFRYEGLFVGLPAMFHSTGKMPNYPNTDGFHVIQLTCSRDLKNWKRLGDRGIFIGPSPVAGGDFDLTQILPPSRPIVKKDELWFYYTGLKYRGAYRYVGTYPDGEMIPLEGYDLARGAICLAVLRRDGFVSLDAGATPGTLQTAAFQLPVGQLHTNAQLQDKGHLIVEVLDEDGRVVGKSKPISGDQPQGQVVWVSEPDGLKAGKSVRLRFTVLRGSLYSYWFSNLQ